VSPVRYELGFCIPEDDILHSHRRENLKSYIFVLVHFKFMKVKTSLDLITMNAMTIWGGGGERRNNSESSERQ
jgi:hypothetical protein